MDREALRKYAEKIIVEREAPATVEAKLVFFNKLWAANVLDQERVLKGAINHLYAAKFKENDHSTKYSILDTAIEFEVSVSTVKNTIYKFSHITLNF